MKIPNKEIVCINSRFRSVISDLLSMKYEFCALQAFLNLFHIFMAIHPSGKGIVESYDASVKSQKVSCLQEKLFDLGHAKT